PTAGGDCLATALDPSDGVVMYRMASNGATAWTRKLDEDGPADGGSVEPDGQGGAFATWYDPLDGAMVQRVDATGQPLFPQVDNFDHGTGGGDGTFEPIGYPACVVSDGKDGAIVATPCNHANNPFREIFAQGVNGAGRTAFRASGLQLSVIAQSGSYVS